MTLNQSDFGAEAGRTRRGDESRRARTNHDEVIPTRWRRVLPIRRMHMGFELLVEFVPWLQLSEMIHENLAVAPSG